MRECVHENIENSCKRHQRTWGEQFTFKSVLLRLQLVQENGYQRIAGSGIDIHERESYRSNPIRDTGRCEERNFRREFLEPSFCFCFHLF